MNITFLNDADLQNISQNKKPESSFSSSSGELNDVESYIELLKNGYYGLAGFADKEEEEAFLKQMSLKSDIGIILEWKDFLKAYLLLGDSTIQPHRICLNVSGQYRALYDNGIEHDYNRFKKWIKWLPAGYYHITNLGGGPAPQSIGTGLENLGNAIGEEVEWQLRNNRLFFWRKGETCARKQLMGGTCDGCTEEIRDICWATNRHTY